MKVEIVLFKNFLELILGLLCPILTIGGYTALIFPIMYFQFIRIKYISNPFTRKVTKDFFALTKSIVGVTVYESYPFAKTRAYLKSFVHVKDESNFGEG